MTSTALRPAPRLMLIWLPLLTGLVSLGLLIAVSTLVPEWRMLEWPLLLCFAACVLFIVVQVFVHLFRKRWTSASFAFLRVIVLLGCLIPAMFVIMISSLFGPAEDFFADNLTIPDDIEIFEPGTEAQSYKFGGDPDVMQRAVRAALAKAGGNEAGFAPSIPSLRKVSTKHPAALLEYLEASPDWHVFLERGNRFASRRWSDGDVPKDTLHGYISDFGGDGRFQTRVLICIDRKPWSRYGVQKVAESTTIIQPKLTVGNNMQESRVMLDCGGVWVEIFEQSTAKERRVTRASLQVLEEEFARFLANPARAVAAEKQRAGELAVRLADGSDAPFHLADGMQPGIYEVTYLLNPGEPGEVYLKAWEVTQNTPLSVERLAEKSRTRLTWSDDPEERFGSKAGFTIYEGDWGKPYAARFEVWFKPDGGGKQRRLAARNYKIEGWQR